MKYDDMLKYMGEFGPYQKRVIFLLVLPYAASSFQILVSVFILAVPEHRCKLPNTPNDTYDIQNDLHLYHINNSVPVNRQPVLSSWSQCTIKTGNLTDGKRTAQACTEWVYDTSTFDTTVVTQFDWVCTEKAYRSHAIMAFMFGMLMGGAIFGPLGDVLGRKITFLMGVALQCISGFCLVVAPDFYTFSILRMISAIGTMPLLVSMYNIGMELVGTNKRVLVAQLMMYSFVVGSVILTGIAYFIRDWVILQITTTVPVMFFMLYWWFIPESPRWLLARGRKQEAEAIITHAAKVNGNKLPPHMFDDVTLDDGVPTRQSSDKLWHLCYTPLLALRTFVVLYNWMVTTMMYYGISLGADNYHGNIYVNFLLCALAEIPAHTIVLLFVDKIGRKKLLVSSFLCGGIACVMSIFPALYAPNLTSVTLMMALIGKLCASISFGMVYMYTVEIFPTVLRAAAMGVCFMFARIGSIVSPYIADLGDLVGGKVGEALPLLTFGGLAMLAGFLTFVLPETVNRRLPETIEDAKHFGRRSPPPAEVEVEPVELCPLNVDDNSEIYIVVQHRQSSRLVNEECGINDDFSYSTKTI